jgi:Tol biopolymer transport system component
MRKSLRTILLFGALISILVFASRSMPHSIPPSVESPIIGFACPNNGSMGICTIRADGTDLRRLTNTEVSGKTVIDTNPVWSPDGKLIAFLSNRDRDSRVFDIYVIKADGSNIRRISRMPADSWRYGRTRPPHWSTDAKRLAYVEGDITGGPTKFWVVNADGSGQRKLDLGNVKNGIFQWVSGYSIAFLSERESKWALYSVDVDGSNIRPLMTQRRVSSATWSPDRKRIAFSAGLGIILYDNLYVSDADGSNVLQLTNEHGQKLNDSRVGAQSIAWSPDSKQVAFMVTVSSGMNSADIIHISVVNTDGTGRRVLTNDTHHNTGPAWSPDGRYIAFHSLSSGGLRRSGIYVINADGSNERFLVEGDSPAWKPCTACSR